MRMQMTREFYIPKGAIKIADKLSDAVAYVYESNAVPYALAFAGKAQKPAWHFRFRNPAYREARIGEFFVSRRKSLAFKAERKASETRCKVEVGQIFNTCWGYDQTNRDFYQVTRVIASSMVEVREIAQTRESTGFMSGNCKGVRDSFVGPPIRCRLNSSGFKVENHYASRWDGESCSWSSYA